MDDYRPRKVNQNKQPILTERPLSVYDNLTTSNNNNNQTNREAAPNSFDDSNFDRNPNKSYCDQVNPFHQPAPNKNFTTSSDPRPVIPKPIISHHQTMRSPAPSSATTTTTTHHPINGRASNAPDAYAMTSSHPQTASHYGRTTDDHHQHHHPLHHLHEQQQQQQQHNNHHNNEYAVAASAAKPIAQYENVAETIKLRNSFRATKPAISDAKSSFFGLAPPQQYSTSTPVAYSSPLSHTMHDRPNPNQSFTGDRAPLISPAAPPQAVPVSAAKSNGEYQNIPSNSAFFHQRVPAAPPINRRDPSGSQCDPSPSASNASTRSAASSSAPSSKGQPLHDQMDGKPPPHSRTNGDDDDSNQQSHHFLEANKRMSEHNPSQAVYMTTTVPQNIKGSNIAGRHTPTRTSLRHSRMIVVNKNYQAPRRPNPLDISHPFLAKLLLIVQLAAGIMITSLAIWVLLWAPNTRTRDNPYWSGIALIIAGILGLVLVEFRRQPRQKMREHCFTFLRLNSTTISVLAMVASFGAFVFATIHLDNVTSANTMCMPSDIFTSSNAFCICLFDVTNTTAEPLELRTVEEGRLTAGGSEFQYRDLSCNEVRGAWKYILFAFTLLNMIAFIVSFLYLMMLCFPKRRKTRSASGSGVVEQQQQHAESSGSYVPVRSVL